MDAGNGAEEAKRLLGTWPTRAILPPRKMTARNAQTVAELCDLYFADAEAGRLMTRRRTQKKASTLLSIGTNCTAYQTPAWAPCGSPLLPAEDIERFMHDVTDGKTASNTKTSPAGWRVYGVAKARLTVP